MFTVRKAQAGDVDEAIAVLGDAFAHDPLMLYLFHDSPLGARVGAMGFFSIFLRVRLALDMPALVLEHGGSVRGAVMGYDTTRPTWPESLTEELRRFEHDTPGFAERLDAYGRLADSHEPSESHYYLGVIGVHPSLQGQGAGKALLSAFCTPSHSDPCSRGVYLETASDSSRQFYANNSFDLRGDGSLDGTQVWCMYLHT